MKLTTGEVGEICIKSSYMMVEYLKRPKETKEYFDSDGFGHSGDLGYYDNKADLFFVDRMKALIKQVLSQSTKFMYFDAKFVPITNVSKSIIHT